MAFRQGREMGEGQKSAKVKYFFIARDKHLLLHLANIENRLPFWYQMA